MSRLHFAGTSALAPAIVLALAVNFPVALLIHRHVEKPLMNLFRVRRGREKSEIRNSKFEVAVSPVVPAPLGDA